MPDVEVPFTYVAHAITIPVRVGDAIDTRFVLDTGIGINLVTKDLCARLGCTTAGEHQGKRMSGQELAVPLTRLAALAVGGVREADVPAGVFDVALPPAFDGVGGFLSLTWFEKRPFTIDYRRRVVVLETEAGLARRSARGAVVPVRLDRDGASLGVLMPMDVSVGEPAWLEIDTGSGGLILNLPYLERLGLAPGTPGVKTVEGKDETQHAYVRHFATLPGAIFPPSAPEMRVEKPGAMFQKIIYDGLVGDAYFKNFVVTYDLARSRLILAKE
jgi:hypothetical protein